MGDKIKILIDIENRIIYHTPNATIRDILRFCENSRVYAQECTLDILKDGMTVGDGTIRISLPDLDSVPDGYPIHIKS